MSFIGEIPGMYWDPSQKRYFSVNRFAAAAAAYSSSDIKRRKLNDKRAERIVEETARQSGRIRREVFDPLTSALLRREYGTAHVDRPQAYARGLVRQAYNRLFGLPYRYIFAARPRPDLGPTVTDLLAVGDGEYQIGTFRVDSKFNKLFSSKSMTWDLGQDVPTSISVNEAAQKILYTHYTFSPNRGMWVVPTSFHNVSVSAPVRHEGVTLGPGLRHNRTVDINSSIAAPPHSSLLFIVGTSEGVVKIDERNMDCRFINHKLIPSEDVSALEFLSENPNILMSGGRNGKLHITDLRLADFGQSADTIKHRSSITHIKSLDPHRIVVAGLESSLCQYDLRFRKGPERTRSILQYPEYHNTATIQIGFDVDIESGVIAAAQEHDVLHAPVQLFSLHGGQKLDSVVSGVGRDRCNSELYRSNLSGRKPPSSIPPPAHLEYDDRPCLVDEVVRCVQFVRDSENGPRSLYIAGDAITRCAFVAGRDSLTRDSRHSGSRDSNSSDDG